MKNMLIKEERNHRVISGNEISILAELPASIFELNYTAENGFSLNETDNSFINAEKLYGEVEAITQKVLRTFDIVNRNLGVLFSGPKGLGKSLTVRNICKAALARGLPVILVKEHFDSITPFIETICQPSVVVFDEFEKIYPDNSRTEKDELEGQDSLLNLFDPSLKGKKLFLLTCNDVGNLSEYLLNRPGRLHYHFRMNRLTIESIAEYCKDKLVEERHSIIPDICSLGARIPDFSYDMLRSIIFELNTYQCELPEARKVLNIEAKAKSSFNFTVFFKSGKIETGFEYIDTSGSRSRINWFSKKGGNRDYAVINMIEARWTGNDDGSLLLEGKNIFWSESEEGSNDCIERIVFVPAKDGYLDEGSSWD